MSQYQSRPSRSDWHKTIILGGHGKDAVCTKSLFAHSLRTFAPKVLSRCFSAYIAWPTNVEVNSLVRLSQVPPIVFPRRPKKSNLVISSI